METQQTWRVAVLGGSFDPPTIGHMQVRNSFTLSFQAAAECINILHFDEIMLVPCGSREDKKGVSLSFDRLKMTQLAVNDFFCKEFPITVNDIEVRHGPMINSYTLIKQLQQQADEERKAKLDEVTDCKEPSKHFYFVLGSDLIPSLDKWTEGKELIE